MDKREVVNALIQEMRAKLESRTPENMYDTDASILLYSRVIAAMTAEQALPKVQAL